MENEIKKSTNFVDVDVKKKFRPVIQYDRKFPQFFDFGKLNKYENNATYAIIGEIKDRYNPDGITFSYKDIAYMSNYLQKDSKGQVYARTGKRFDKFIEGLQEKLKGVSYRRPLPASEGKEGYEDFPLFTNKFTVNHSKQELIVHLSDSVIQDEIIDENGNIIQKAMRITDLFNNSNWADTKYLKFSRELHNSLSVDAQNLYRWISEYRYYGKASLDAETFENRVMHFITPTDKKNKNSILRRAVKELQDLTYDNHNQIFTDLDFYVERYRNKPIKYHFTFKPFSIDLNYIDEIHGTNILFEITEDTRQIFKKTDQIDKDVLNRFHEVFSTQPHHDNDHNRKQLISYIDSTSPAIVIEALSRTAQDGRRGVGWLFKLLQNWEKEGVKSVNDIESAEARIFGQNKKTEDTNIPKWSTSHPDYKGITNSKEPSKEILELRKQIQATMLKLMNASEDDQEYNNLNSEYKNLTEQLKRLELDSK